MVFLAQMLCADYCDAPDCSIDAEAGVCAPLELLPKEVLLLYLSVEVAWALSFDLKMFISQDLLVSSPLRLLVSSFNSYCHQDDPMNL